MQRNLLNKTLLISATLFVSLQVKAASLASYCYLKDDGQSKIEGENINKRLPLASVSKVATAYWAVNAKGSDYRFETIVHTTPVGPNIYDVHISGSRDPYFGKESLHYVISQLNKLGITKVSKFTYDENFKFFWMPTAESVAIGHYDLQDPKPKRVQAELLSQTSLRSGYKLTFDYAQSLKINMVENPSFTVQTVAYLDSQSFNPNGQTKSFSFRSAPLLGLLKEMNRNSNNHAANQIFEHLGGADIFNKYVQDKFDVSSKDITFFNGSGDRFDTETGGLYNQASCKTMLNIIKALRDDLKKEGHDIENVMALAGADANSTVGRIYTNDTTRNALVAKTGTVSPAITLGGMISTQEGNVYFLYNMATVGTKADWSAARADIRVRVTKLLKSFNGGKEIDYKSVKFISFDNESSFIERNKSQPSLP